jgi:CDP-4-dehydro-6-deoxyglucose reductase, E3
MREKLTWTRLVLLNSMSGPLRATLESRTVVAPGVADLVLAMRDPPRLDFRAGQFVSIAVGKDDAGSVLRRSYSIASPSTEPDRLRLIIRVIPEGTASELLMSLPMGGEVQMTGPHGFFVLDRQHPGDLVFGATGTGMAAVMPMLAELAEGPPTGRRYLYWGVRHEADLFAREEVEALARKAGASLDIYLSAPPAGWPGGHGRITGAIVDKLPGLETPTFYLVGNGAMIAELKRELVARGVNRKQQVRTEAFFD